VRHPLTILAEADQAFAGWTCDASTDCCRFGVTGREPYVTRAEWDLIKAAWSAQGRKPLARAEPVDEEQRCPFLSAAGRCLVYSARPLGCRTFYCERGCPPPGASSRVDKRRHNQLAQELAEQSGEKGRPLRAWVEGWADEAKGSARAAAKTPARRSDRRR
jgi:Fe-S-cluster containining protein